MLLGVVKCATLAHDGWPVHHILELRDVRDLLLLIHYLLLDLYQVLHEVRILFKLHRSLLARHYFLAQLRVFSLLLGPFGT